MDGRFFRCHRSYLINLNHLKSYRNNTAFMADGKEIPVSRLRSKEFSKVILQYMRNGDYELIDYLDFFSIYVMTSLEIFMNFWFL